GIALITGGYNRHAASPLGQRLFAGLTEILPVRVEPLAARANDGAPGIIASGEPVGSGLLDQPVAPDAQMAGDWLFIAAEQELSG
ncbi:hypothetical protein, partial [Priestia megaterium]|uniref:hypothetical protein n=1 Tax=Priestia megaterium TaxID=1404 RepID=UPI0035B6A568